MKVLLIGAGFLGSVHPETLPNLKVWIPGCPLFGVQTFRFGLFASVSGWTLGSHLAHKFIEPMLPMF